MSRKSTCRGAAVLFLCYWIFRLKSVQMLCNFTILKSQHNYSLSQPAMEWLNLHLLLSCQYHYPSIMSLSSLFSGLSIVSSKQVGNHLKWWWLNTGGVLKIAWLHTKLQNPSRILMFVPQDSDCGSLPRRTISRYRVWINAWQCIGKKCQGTGGWTTIYKSYEQTFLL